MNDYCVPITGDRGRRTVILWGQFVLHSDNQRSLGYRVKSCLETRQNQGLAIWEQDIRSIEVF